MIKYYDHAITFSEFPDEIALCLNISNCPGYCKHCSEPWLLQDIGTELTAEEITKLLDEHPDVSLVGFMGGDRSITDIITLTAYIKMKHPGIKVGMYSGKNSFDMRLLKCLDCYKIGPWIMPEGDPETWHKKPCGPLCFPWSNQKYFEKHGDEWVDATDKFRQKPLNNLERYIIK